MKGKFSMKVNKKVVVIMVMIIVVISGTTFAFNDVANSKWYFGFVNRISELGII